MSPPRAGPVFHDSSGCKANANELPETCTDSPDDHQAVAAALKAHNEQL
jgi:hypothetical protein